MVPSINLESEGENRQKVLTTHDSKPMNEREGEYTASKRRKSFDKKSESRDPLSLSIRLLIYPIFLLALLLVHSIYYLSIKARSTWKYQRSIVEFLKKEERTSKHQKKRRQSIDQKYEQASQIRLAKIGSGDHIVSLPRHLALALGPKPIRTSLLLFRSFIKPFSKLGLKKSDKISDERRYKDDTREQKQFAWDNLQSALKNCALSGIRELTIYDKNGYLANQFSETHKESIEQEWNIPTDGNEEDIKENGVGIKQQSMQITATIYRPFRSPTLNEFRRQTINSINNQHNGTNSVQVRINILGPEDSFDALAKAATILCKRKRNQNEFCQIDENMIRDILSEHGYPSDPELLIIHGGPRQVSTLHSFPPLLIRLCEIFHDIDAIPYLPLTSRSFEKALEAFAKSEQRLGK